MSSLRELVIPPYYSEHTAFRREGSADHHFTGKLNARSRSLVSDRSQGLKAGRDDKTLRDQKILRIQPFSTHPGNSFCPKYLRTLDG
jgi:hypothetical protein